MVLVTAPARRPVPALAGDRSAFFVGSRVIPLDRVTDAGATRTGSAPGRSLWLFLGGTGVPRLIVPLELDGERTFSPEQAHALADMHERCPIVIPRDQYDPRGRMTRQANPGRLDAADAAELVRDPAASGRLLPG